MCIRVWRERRENEGGKKETDRGSKVKKKIILLYLCSSQQLVIFLLPYSPLVAAQ
jgi:hypothetical protein